MAEEIKILDSRNVKTRIVLIAMIILALAFGWFSIRWQLGNMLAELTSPSEPNAKEIAATAVRLAPRDPLTGWFRASAEKNVFTPEKIDESVGLFESVVRLSPNDFRWWVELGRANEQAEKPLEAERAFKRAVELAPSYTYPHWQLGNFYLRQNRSDEAFAELRKAAEKNDIYREQVYSIAWDFFDQDPARVEELSNNSPSAKTNLVRFYMVKNRPADALRIWNTLSAEERKLGPATTKLIAQGMFERRFYRSAVEFARQLEIDPDAKAEAVTNGGFEKQIVVPNETYFGWKVEKKEKMDVKTDAAQKREGERSLRVLYSGLAGADAYNITQYIAVEPSRRYRLSFWLKTENLKSAGPPTLEIFNANDNKIIAVSKAFPTGSNDWQQIVIDFTAPENCEGVGLRTARAFCGENCPIIGAFWYDDFKISRL